jgi:hypothetical protein
MKISASRLLTLSKHPAIDFSSLQVRMNIEILAAPKAIYNDRNMILYVSLTQTKGLALLETLARNPQPQKDKYIEAVQNTNKLLETEFNNNEKLSELFLSSKNGKEALLLLAKNKNFPTINNWLARTKEALPAETISLIKDTDAHQREARKSLSTSSNASNSGNSVDKCLRFLRLVSLKYSN